MKKQRPPCSGLTTLTPMPIANRPGHDKLAYRVGTHASFLESMLARLTTHQIADEITGLKSVATSVRGDTPLHKLKVRNSNDPSIALMDAWSTIADLLTFYQERIANEGYLRTANERLSLEQLARLVGYQLKPGLSAATYLAFTVEKHSPPVLIPKGTPATSVPGPNDPPQPQTFETSHDIEAREEWNEIKPRTTRYTLIREETAQLVSQLFAVGTALDLEQNDLLLIKFQEGTPIPRFVDRVEVQPDRNQTVIHLRDSDTAFPEYVRAIHRALTPLVTELGVGKWNYDDDENEVPRFIGDLREKRNTLQTIIATGRTKGLADFDTELGTEIERLSDRTKFAPFFQMNQDVSTTLKPLTDLQSVLNRLHQEDITKSDDNIIPLIAQYATVNAGATTKKYTSIDGTAKTLLESVRAVAMSGMTVDALVKDDPNDDNNDGLVTKLIDELKMQADDLLAQAYLRALEKWHELGTANAASVNINFFGTERSDAVLTALGSVSASVTAPRDPLLILVRIADDRFRAEDEVKTETQIQGFEPAEITILEVKPARLPQQGLNEAEQLLLRIPEVIARPFLELGGNMGQKLTELERATIRFRAQNMLSFTVKGRFDSDLNTGSNDMHAPLSAELGDLLTTFKDFNLRDSGDKIAAQIEKGYTDFFKRADGRLPIFRYFDEALKELKATANPRTAHAFQQQIATSYESAFGITAANDNGHDPGSISGIAQLRKAARAEVNTLQSSASALSKLGVFLNTATVTAIDLNEADAGKLIPPQTFPDLTGLDNLTSAKFRSDLEELKGQFDGTKSLPFDDLLQLIARLKKGLVRYVGVPDSVEPRTGYFRLVGTILDPGDRGSGNDPRRDITGSTAGAIYHERRTISSKVQSQIRSILTTGEDIPGTTAETGRIKAESANLKNNIKDKDFLSDIEGRLLSFLQNVLGTTQQNDPTFDPTPLFAKLPPTRDGIRARTLFADIRTQYLQMTAARAIGRIDVSTADSDEVRSVAGLTRVARDLRNNIFLPDPTGGLSSVSRATSSIAGAQLLQALDSDVREGLFARWRNVPPVPPRFAVYAFRHRASLFGNAAQRHSGEKPIPPAAREAGQEWTVRRENRKVVYLEREYADVSPTVVGVAGSNDASFIALAKRAETANDQETAVVAPPDVFNIEDVAIVSRADYGQSSKTTRIEIDRKWWEPIEKSDQVAGTEIHDLRNTSAFVAPYRIDLAEEPFDLPIGRVDRRRVVSGEAAKGMISENLFEECDNEIELVDNVEGLTADQIIVIAGERADAPGVRVEEHARIDEAQIIWRDWPNERPHTLLRLRQPLQFAYKRDTVNIYANVAAATHGATVNEEILGSGDAAKQFQRFRLQNSDVSHLPSNSGEAAQPELRVRVNDVLWDQRENVAQLGHDEAWTSSVVSGTTTVQFGDGEHGVRLPTGIENVRAVYRTGIGSAGNVKSGQVSQISKPVLGISGVKNPVPGTGGVDPESLYQGRESTSRYSSALGRLISLRDYEDFARNFGGVAKSTANTSVTRGRTQISVWIALAGDSVAGPELLDTLARALRNGSEADVDVIVNPRRLAVLSIAAVIGVNDRFRPDAVLERVEQKLRDRYSFERAEFGERVQRSEAIQMMQAVKGVDFVRVTGFDTVRDRAANGSASNGPADDPTGDGDSGGGTTASGAQADPLQHLSVEVESEPQIELNDDEITFLPPSIDRAVRLTAEGGKP